MDKILIAEDDEKLRNELEIFLNNEYSPTLLRYIFILSMFLVFAFYFIFKSIQPYKTIGE